MKRKLSPWIILLIIVCVFLCCYGINTYNMQLCSINVPDEKKLHEYASSSTGEKENLYEYTSSNTEEKEVEEISECIPISIYLAQIETDGSLSWELDILDEAEIVFVENLLSTKDLLQLEPSESIWPDGGSVIGFKICYADKTISGACNPHNINAYWHSRQWTWTQIAVDDIFYAYPAESGNQLLEFLKNKNVTVID